jgi:RNA-binding protein YhbY
MNSELEVLLDVVTRLEGAGIAYMLTGSVAMSVYAEPRMTRDIDIVVELAQADAARVVELFSPEYYVADDAVRSAISARTLFNLFHLSRLIKVDLIVRSDDEFQRHEFARRLRHELGGRAVSVIGKEDLILSKLVWAAPTESAFQLRDVRKLLASGVDEAYLSDWSVRLGVDALLRRCTDAGHES